MYDSFWDRLTLKFYSNSSANLALKCSYHESYMTKKNIWNTLHALKSTKYRIYSMPPLQMFFMTLLIPNLDSEYI